MRVAIASIAFGLLVASALPTRAQMVDTIHPAVERDAAASIEHRGETGPAAKGNLLQPATVPEPMGRDGWVLDGALAVRGFAECLARHRETRARNYLATVPNTEESAEAVGRLTGRYSSCLYFSEYRVGELRAQDQALRGALSESMYLRDHPERPPVRIVSAEPRAIPQDLFAERMENAGDPAQELIRMFAECITDRQPTIVDALLRTEFRSSAENEMLGMLQPSMAPCLFEGQTLTIGPENLRFALADALYRRASTRTGNAQYSEAAE